MEGRRFKGVMEAKRARNGGKSNNSRCDNRRRSIRSGKGGGEDSRNGTPWRGRCVAPVPTGRRRRKARHVTKTVCVQGLHEGTAQGVAAVEVVRTRKRHIKLFRREGRSEAGWSGRPSGTSGYKERTGGQPPLRKTETRQKIYTHKKS